MSVVERTEAAPTQAVGTKESQPRPRRKLSSRIGLLHIIAIVSGVLAFLLILSWMRSQQELISVAVAGQDIRAGNVIDTASFNYTEIPADGAFGDTLVLEGTEADALDGSVAVRFIEMGEPILDSDFRPVDTPEGLRAMSIPLQVNQAVGGVIVEGDRVDVIGFDDIGPRYIATGVAVLDVPGESGGAFGSSTSYAITLAVNDIEALELAAALEAGDLHVLRSTGAPDVTLDRLLEIVEGDGGAGASDDAPPPSDGGDG